jgi:hypothetical protein
MKKPDKRPIVNGVDDSKIESDKILSNIERYLKVIAKILLDDKLDKYLVDENHKKIYDLTGQYSRKEISKQTGSSTGSISSLWNKWEELGLLEKNGKSYKKVID